jgi:hypothetical protein
MDIKALKLELLERIALIDDESRLLVLKRILDLPRGYGVANEKMSVVKEAEEPYVTPDHRMFTFQEVMIIVDAVREEILDHELEEDISPEQLAELEERDRQMRTGEVKGITWDEAQRILDDDRRLQRGEE